MFGLRRNNWRSILSHFFKRINEAPVQWHRKISSCSLALSQIQITCRVGWPRMQFKWKVTSQCTFPMDSISTWINFAIRGEVSFNYPVWIFILEFFCLFFSSTFFLFFWFSFWRLGLVGFLLWLLSFLRGFFLSFLGLLFGRFLPRLLLLLLFSF